MAAATSAGTNSLKRVKSLEASGFRDPGGQVRNRIDSIINYNGGVIPDRSRQATV
jgi:hypothetical protein